jgi:hypothetical protein
LLELVVEPREILEACRVKRVVADQITFALPDATALRQLAQIDFAILHPFVNFFVPAQVVIAGNDDRSFGGQFHLLDQIGEEIVNSLEFFVSAAIRQVA